VFLRLFKFALVGALVCSLGLHWSLLQSVAWVKMIVVYSQDSSFKEAVVKTFDGKHPCSLCKAVEQGKKSEKKSDKFTPEKKLEFAHAGVSFVFTAPTSFWTLTQLESSADSLQRTPPAPPPRPLHG
jgi:hypothetical protein